MSNSNKSKKNNSISSILGLNKLRNTTRQIGSSIESGLKSAKNGITGTVDKASNSIMPDFVSETSNQQNNNKNNNNNRVSLGNLLIGNNNKTKKNSNKNINSLMNSNKNKNKINSVVNTVESDVEKVGNDLKNNAVKMSAFALGMGWFKYFLLFMILLFFGINIFSYLAKTSTFFANITESIFRPIAKLFGFSLTKTVEKVVDTSAEGAKYGIDITQGAIDDVLTLGQDNNDSITNKNKNSSDDSNVASETSFIGELEQDITPSNNEGDEDAEPADTNSAISYGGSKKGAYCYVGVDKGYRSCVKLTDDEKCMSGKVFPTKELCVNPSLRA